ncbi:MAG: carboxypeptidase regulatory-like domain-containing protein, partial [Rhodanobacteraceae bacterium]|nr:carboxypeptidase regulatory-like domain-containing protein [Rhodanobacteraceae bacterium]
MASSNRRTNTARCGWCCRPESISWRSCARARCSARCRWSPKAGEVAELIVNFETDGRATVSLESSAQSTRDLAEKVEIADPGVLEGQVLSAENGKPIAGARVYIAGTPLDLTTDADGRFSAEVPGGSYSVSVLAPSFASQTLDAVEVPAKGKAQRSIELTPAGLELAEFVVTEPFVEGSLAAFVEERRTSASVTDILGAEQISRAGDSDAAGALKRVTGLTLVDDKYIYVRGLGERYSSTLLNGAQVPSPDPTRRVVPLDLFPTEVLQGIVVQKTYSADMPGEFAGGTIQLRTRGVPESFFVRISAGIEYADGTTGKDGLRYDGGQSDWTGYDDDTRYAPSVFDEPSLPSDPLALEAAGEELAALGYSTREDSLIPNAGTGIGVGDKFQFGDSDISLGYIAAARYAHSWDDQLEQRNTYSLFQDDLIVAEDFTRRNTERSIDSSLFGALGLKIGELHSLNFTATQLRQTTDQTQIDEGLTSSGNIDQITELEWVENELQTLQLDGEHSLPQLNDLHVKWQVTDSKAGRYSPNTREYRFTFDEQLQDFTFESFNQQRIDELDDNALDYGIDLGMPFHFAEGIDVEVKAGVAQLDRDRESSIRRFRFSGRRPPGPIYEFEDLLQPENIGPGGLR